MPKQIHVHVHNHATRDGWEEDKHPRADDGKFGAGGGTSKQENLSERQAKLRESGSPRYAGRTNPPEKDGGGAPKAKAKEVHFKEAKDSKGRTIYKLYDKDGHAGSVASLKEANRWWADHGGKKAEAAYDKGESGLRS